MVKGKVKKRVEKKVFSPTIKKVKLNNKTRKGEYYYIKGGKGERGSYYKVKKGLKKEDYLNAFKYKVITKSKGVIKGAKPEDYLRQISQRRKVEDILGKGFAKVEIGNINTLNAYGEHKAYTSLLMNQGKGGDGKPIVRDKELIKILVRNENVQKYKHRLGYQVSLIGNNDEILAKLESPTGKTLKDVKLDIKSHIKVGQEILDSYPTTAKEMKNRNYTYSHNQNGKIKAIKVLMIFRKA